MNYSTIYLFNNTWQKVDYVAKFFKTDLQSYPHKMREKYNSLETSATSEKWHPRIYQLIFSDYANCSIFRMPEVNYGQGCMVFLTPTAVKSGMPRNCKCMFENACSDSGILRELHDKECKLSQQ
ncbi:hypothetical protein V5799_006104 [Amblyomma americanum]|uniref:Lipocalin n=1 Tax=Amblyomma americanum TaxID=6943 RepID=A0AAQ4DXC4_AMBAM